MNEQNAKNRVVREREHNKGLKSDHDRIWGSTGKSGSLRVKNRTQFLIRAGGIGADHRVLELGFGTGIYTSEIAGTGAEIDAYELNEELVKVAQKRHLPHVHFYAGDVMDLPSSLCGVYDCVYGNAILHHLDLDIILPRLFMLLKAGGNIVFAEPNMINPQVFIMKNIKFLKPYFHESPDETAFYPWSVRKKLQQYGFEKVKAVPFDFLHPRIPEKLVPFMDSLGKMLEKTPVIRFISGSLLISARKPENAHE